MSILEKRWLLSKHGPKEAVSIKKRYARAFLLCRDTIH